MRVQAVMMNKGGHAKYWALYLDSLEYPEWDRIEVMHYRQLEN